MKTWKYVKGVIFFSFAVLLIIFAEKTIGRESLSGQTHYIIGGLMIIYGLESVITHFALKKKFEENQMFYWGLIEISLGTILLFIVRDAETVYVMWAVWSILREANELREIVGLFKEKIMAILNLLESLTVIAFSLVFIINPVHQHALTHTYLLAIELILTAFLPIIYDVIRKKKENKISKEEQAQ